MVFLGTPGFAVPALQAAAAACDVVAVVTRPDRPRGRGRATAASEVSEAALQLGLEVMKPERASETGTQGTLASLGADLFAVVAFGEILSRELLQIPRLGCINLHGSLLPDLRGASPVQRALWEGRCGTGVTTLWMDEGIDTGDLILQRWLAVEPADDGASLAGRLAQAGAPLLARSLVLAHEGRAPRVPQDRTAGSYAPRLAKSDGVVDWSLDVEAAWGRQRAVTPWPGAVTQLGGRSLTLIETRPHHRLPATVAPGTVLEVEPEGVLVQCGVGALQVRRVKSEGRSELEAAAWARGARVKLGDRLTGKADS
ncbi:MAG TPA: methionyl-tRNA formyltransferase [Candidatus Eisenbacteria bacterium]